jgi:SNF2 family DNA or RNA helicase
MSISLMEFIEKHGKALGEKVERELTPLYNPMENDPAVEMAALLRNPFPVQEQVIKGLAKALYHEGRKKLFVCGEMGTGKTFIGLGVIAMSSKPMRSLVVCPGHLVEKWAREAKATIPGVRVIDLAVKDVISVLDKLRNEKMPLKTHEVWIISKERAKLGYSWGPVYLMSRRSGYPICPDCGDIPKDGDDEVLSISTLNKKRCTCQCGSPLWRALPRPRRYPPAEFIKKYLKGAFDMVILDEVHDYKAGDSLQGHTMGQLAVSAPYFLGLTGTLNGGYADNLFYLLYRLQPERLKDFGYAGAEKWQRAYGVIEEIKKLDDEDHAYGRIKRRNIIVKRKPGVSPEVIGRFFLDKSCFIRLADVIDGLPPYDEIVLGVKMEAEQKDAYDKLEAELRDAVNRFKMKATSSMLQSLLCYPDSCVVFPEHIEIKGKEDGVLQVLTTIKAPKLEISLLPKEKELLRIVKDEKSQGRKVLIYLTFTGNRDTRGRIKEVLQEKGFAVGVLPETVEPKKREQWIDQHAYMFDVLLSNPELVKVGLDLVQFPTVVFYQVGYNIFTLRQAARRSWRIGQKEPVRVYYLTYKDTMQETAISLIAKKLEIALLVEGDLPEGLAQYQVEGGSLIEEMAKALVEGRKYSGAETAWANFRKKEVESSLGIGQKETIFTEKALNLIGKSSPVVKTSVIENTVVNVTIIEGKRKKMSRLSIRYGDLDEQLKDKEAQFALF